MMTDKLAKQEQPMSQRFMNKVIAEFGSSVGEIALTDFQKRLAQNYFIAIDATLKKAEEKRLKKSEKYQDKVPVVWANVNMEQLARDVVSFARIGLDPSQKNHINMVPYKNNSTGKYDIGFVDGYRGIELQAKKYGQDVPDAVIVELVYSNDKFKSIKKDRNNLIESYEFEIVDDFNRGEIKGGFYYHVYEDCPEKNRLVVFTLADILKRKPDYASAEFWGGKKPIWKDGKKVGEEEIEGWFEKMCHKTIYRAAYRDITIDSQKIDDDYLRLKQNEMQFAEAEVQQEIDENTNGEIIDIEGGPVVEGEFVDEQPEEKESEPEKAKEAKKPQKDTAKGQQTIDQAEPGF